MMQRLFIILMFFLPISMRAESNMMLEKANQVYHNKNYSEAIHLYSQLLSDGYEHEVLYYNLGNAYYKTGKTGLAIWCYKKALSIHENNLYSDNLALTEKKISNPIPTLKEIFFVRWWRSVLALQSSNGWAMWALILFLGSIILMILRKLGKWQGGNLVPTIGLLACSFALLLSYSVHSMKSHAIIIENTMFNGNDRTQSGGISEGIEVTIQSKGKTQALVSLPDGRVGSVPLECLREL